MPTCSDLKRNASMRRTTGEGIAEIAAALVAASERLCCACDRGSAIGACPCHVPPCHARPVTLPTFTPAPVKFAPPVVNARARACARCIERACAAALSPAARSPCRACGPPRPSRGAQSEKARQGREQSDEKGERKALEGLRASHLSEDWLERCDAEPALPRTATREVRAAKSERKGACSTSTWPFASTGAQVFPQRASLTPARAGANESVIFNTRDARQAKKSRKCERATRTSGSHLSQRDLASLNEVAESSRRGDEQGAAFVELAHLHADLGATVDHDGLHGRALHEALRLAEYLGGQLARRCQDEAAWLGAAVVWRRAALLQLGHELVQHGEEEGASLARARLRARHQVAPRQADGDRVALHRRRAEELSVLDVAQQLRVQPKLAELLGGRRAVLAARLHRDVIVRLEVGRRVLRLGQRRRVQRHALALVMVVAVPTGVALASVGLARVAPAPTPAPTASTAAAGIAVPTSPGIAILKARASVGQHLIKKAWHVRGLRC
eukprot:6187709-Pleurochrysis_carterae.AAC.6